MADDLEEVVVTATRIPQLSYSDLLRVLDRQKLDGGGGGGGGLLTDLPTGQEIYDELTEENSECGEGKVKVVVTSGATTHTGCASISEVQEYIGDDNIARVPSDSNIGMDIIKSATDTEDTGAGTEAIREFLTETLSNEDLTAEEIVDILNEITGLESTVDQGSEIVWQQGDVTDVLGDVQIQIPDFAAILESMGGGGGGGDDASATGGADADSGADSGGADADSGADAGGADSAAGADGGADSGGADSAAGADGGVKEGDWIFKDGVWRQVGKIDDTTFDNPVIVFSGEIIIGPGTEGDTKSDEDWAVLDSEGKFKDGTYTQDIDGQDVLVEGEGETTTDTVTGLLDDFVKQVSTTDSVTEDTTDSVKEDTEQPPAAGTVLSSVCDGDDRYTVIADGQGGTTTKVDVGGCKTTTDKVTGLLGDFIKAASTDGQKGTGDAGDGTSGGGNNTVTGGNGNDTVTGGGGNDNISVVGPVINDVVDIFTGDGSDPLDLKEEEKEPQPKSRQVSKSMFQPFYMDLNYDPYQLTPLSFEQKDYMQELTGIIQRNSRGMLT